MLGREKAGQVPSGAAGRSDRTVVTAAAVMVLAAVTCAATPAVLAVLGGAALGSLLGWPAGAIVFVAATGGLVVSMGRRRSGASPTAPEPVRS